MEQITIKGKNYLKDGITRILDSENISHEIKIADYPLQTVIERRGKDWYVVSHPSADMKKIRQAEDFYYLTRDILPYDAYLSFIGNYEYPMNQWKKNPYVLLELAEIPLPVLDSKVMIDTFALRKTEIKWAIRNILKANESQGHTFLPFSLFSTRLQRLLSEYPIEPEMIRAALNYYSEEFYFDGERVAFLSTYKKEEFIHFKIMELAQTPGRYYIKPSYTDSLSKSQNDAVNGIFAAGNISILTGGPGTGKTTTIQDIVQRFQNEYPDKNIHLLAPTGRAARRICEVFGGQDVETATVHKFLGLGHFWNKREMQRIEEADFIIIDESSMIGVDLFYEILTKVDLSRVKLLLSGDIDQLPSVEAGNILADLIHLRVPVFYLTENFRSNGSIVPNAVRINEGNTDFILDDSFQVIPATGEEAEKICMSLDRNIILTPYRKAEKHGAEYMNLMVHKSLYPDKVSSHGHPYFMAGEPVVILKTSYKDGYVNGETGTVSYVTAEAIYSDFSGAEKAVKNKEDISLAYALTVHKCQGSEYPSVVVYIPDNCHSFFTRQMLYTAVTRAKDKVVLVGNPEEIKKIIENKNKAKRNTFLGLS